MKERDFSETRAVGGIQPADWLWHTKRHGSLVGILIATALGLGSVEAKTGSTWSEVSVEVKASHPVTATHQWTEQDENFSRLKVTLANEGTEPLTIETITVRIPLAVKTTNETEILFGASDMGRTSLLRQPAGKLDNKSSSQFFAMVKLAEDDYLIAGALSWRIFLPNITFKEGAFEIRSKGENKQILPGGKIDYEQIVLTRGKNWHTLLSQFGRAIARENKMDKPKDASFSGWATWDYYGRIFTANDVYKNMDQLNQLPVKANIVQIDGGWWTERGDYTTVRPNLPGGIKAMVDRIRAEGKIAGLHFDGFRGDAKSEICKKHPEYFLHDQDGKLIVNEVKLLDKVMEFTYFDYSHPGARAHIAECIRTMKDEWGIRYFKVDFMRYGLEDDIKKRHPSVKSFKAHVPGITGVERFRLGMQAIRDAIGEENYFLGCSAVFGPTIGFVDGMRTGADIHPRFEAFGERALGNAGNFYLNSVYDLDADYIVARAAADEDATIFADDKKSGGDVTENEAKMWADFVSLYSNFRINSDNLQTLRPARKEIVSNSINAPKIDETVPLDVWKHATNALDPNELLLSRSGKEIYLGIFNWGDQPKSYSLPAFGKSAHVQLDGRHSIILKYEGVDSFDQLAQKLQSR